MGRDTLSRAVFLHVSDAVTKGGSQAPTSDAEEKIRDGEGLDPLVDPKGPAHLGPVRLSLPRFEKQGKYWVLTMGIPMPKSTLLDTTGSMGNNVELAFKALPHSYEMLTSGSKPVLGRYDTQISTAIFNDVQDGRDIAVLAWSQFEMAERIAMQMAMLPPGRNGCGNGKEDPQFGLFGAAYLVKARINEYGLKYHHFTVSDEPIVPTIDLGWLKKLFGDDVLERVKETGNKFTPKSLPDTAQTVKHLQDLAHAFFLMVNQRHDVKTQWTELYGADHVVMLPGGTQYLHAVEAVIIGLTEGVLDLKTAKDFLREHGTPVGEATQIVRAVAHIPLGAQKLLPNFDKLPQIGDRFREKTDLWPVCPEELAQDEEESPEDDSGPNWA